MRRTDVELFGREKQSQRGTRKGFWLQIALLGAVLSGAAVQLGLRGRGFAVAIDAANGLRALQASLPSLTTASPLVSVNPSNNSTGETRYGRWRHEDRVYDGPAPKGVSRQQKDSDEETSESQTQPEKRRLSPRMVAVKRAHVKRQGIVRTQACQDDLGTFQRILAHMQKEYITLLVNNLWLVALAGITVYFQSATAALALLISLLLDSISAALQLPSTKDDLDRYSASFESTCSFVIQSAPIWTSVLGMDAASLALAWLTLLAACGVTYAWREPLLQSQQKDPLQLVFRAMLIVSSFFALAFHILWAVELFATPISPTLTVGYRGFVVALTALLIPTLLVGLVASVKRSTPWMALFLCLELLFIANGGFMVADVALLSTLADNWMFFRFLGIVTAILLVSLFTMGIGSLLTFKRVLRTSVAEKEKTDDMSEEKPVPSITLSIPRTPLPGQPPSYEEFEGVSYVDALGLPREEVVDARPLTATEAEHASFSHFDAPIGSRKRPPPLKLLVSNAHSLILPSRWSPSTTRSGTTRSSSSTRSTTSQTMPVTAVPPVPSLRSSATSEMSR